ncbi:hypothetical protein [Halorubrum sp. DTA98]|uniref:hypothetical protein n=1 Tax=Halorubrum sp. DTA98 TaxID=3402163 RepID=UPI003AAE5DF1
MTDDADVTDGDIDIEDAVERFLDDTATAFGEYDQGYADADATLSVIRSHCSELRDVVDDSA